MIQGAKKRVSKAKLLIAIEADGASTNRPIAPQLNRAFQVEAKMPESNVS
jgi:hypothetical protein